jgi:hypothetical protein
MKRRTAQEQKQFENAFEEHCGASREGGRAVKLKEALSPPGLICEFSRSRRKNHVDRAAARHDCNSADRRHRT